MLPLTKCFPKTHFLEDTCPSSSESSPPRWYGGITLLHQHELGVAPLCSILGLGFVSCGMLLNPWGLGFAVGFSLKALHTWLSYGCSAFLSLPLWTFLPSHQYFCTTVTAVRAGGSHLGWSSALNTGFMTVCWAYYKAKRNHCVFVLAPSAEWIFQISGKSLEIQTHSLKHKQKVLVF